MSYHSAVIEIRSTANRFKMSKLIILSALVLFVKLINASPVAETSSKNLEYTFIGCIVTILLELYVILDITKCKNFPFFRS